MLSRLLTSALFVVILTNLVSGYRNGYYYAHIQSPRVPTEKTKIERHISLKGLKNFGSTCYLNSILQALFHTYEFRNSFLNSTFCGESNCESGLRLKQIFEIMRDSNNPPSLIDASLSAIIKSLSLDKSTQEDAHEILMRLLNSINRSNGCLHDQPISLFKGLLQSKLTHSHVPFEKVIVESFIDVNVDVNVDSETSMEDFSLVGGLRQQLCGNDTLEYNMPGLGLQNLLRIKKILSWPKLLLIHLKRFEFDVKRNLINKVKNDAIVYLYY